jgi:hypothetical protein
MGITAESKNANRGCSHSCKCVDVSEDGTLLLPRQQVLWDVETWTLYAARQGHRERLSTSWAAGLPISLNFTVGALPTKLHSAASDTPRVTQGMFSSGRY